MARRAASKPAKATAKRTRPAAPAQNVSEADFTSGLEQIQYLVEANEHAAGKNAPKNSKRDKKRKPRRSRAKREKMPASSDESDEDSANDAKVSSWTAHV